MGRYLDCPHCGRRHVSQENIELCRKIHDSLKHLAAIINRKTPTTEYYLEVSHLLQEQLRRTIKDKHDYKCARCSKVPHNGEVHHIKPKIEGGTDDPNNLTFLCKKCHNFVHKSKSHVEQIEKITTLEET